MRADGASEAEALAKIDRLIDGWRSDPQSLRRVIKRRAAVIPPSASRSFASGAVADAVYGVRLLRARPGYAAMTILTIALGVGAVRRCSASPMACCCGRCRGRTATGWCA